MISRKASLTEILAIIIISVVVITFSWSNFNRNSLRKQAAEQTKSEIKLLKSAVESYKAHYGFYPYSQSDYNGSFNFVEQLSSVPVNDKEFKGGKRPMFADFSGSTINFSADDFELPTAVETIANDPYDCPYFYVYSKVTDSFYIYSPGLDGENETEDDVRSDE